MVVVGGEPGSRCIHRNRCLRVKAAWSIRRKGSDYGGGGVGGGGLVAAVMLVARVVERAD